MTIGYYNNNIVTVQGQQITGMNDSSTVMLPLGSIIAWADYITGVPALTGGWVQCDGQTLSDADSPYNGQVIPNINGNNYFLRGNSTSGSTGGASTHTHANLVVNSSALTDHTTAGPETGGSTTLSKDHYHSITVSFATSSSNIPKSIKLKWIMRIK